METLEQKIRRVTAEPVAVAPYDPHWPDLFQQEKTRLLACLPPDLVVRIEHFGSTAVPGLAAKPVIDVLIEVADVDRARTLVPQLLEPQGCDCFWRPTSGDDTGPWFTWCIRRDPQGHRTHHLHFIAPGAKAAELHFRDLLRQNPQLAQQYAQLKYNLAATHPNDRIAYTEAKTQFITTALNPDP